MYLYKHPIFKNYACDNVGNIINLDNGTIRKTYTPHSGYEEIKIKNIHVLVHRFVWEAVNDTIIPKGYEINHIDKNTHNNQPSNLEILTIAEHRRLHKKGSGKKK